MDAEPAVAPGTQVEVSTHVPINADKPHLWKQDIAASVDLFNDWFLRFAPAAYRETRVETTAQVERALRLTGDLRRISPGVLAANPQVLPTLRMATAPPIARDRLVGLAHVSKNLVTAMERDERLPPRMSQADVDEGLRTICVVIDRLLDRDVFPWLETGRAPSRSARHRAATIIADRLCGAVADPIVRNAQEQRQLALIGQYLDGKGYTQEAPTRRGPLTGMHRGTYAFRLSIHTGTGRGVKVPMDAVVQPHVAASGALPILIEAKSAGDFTNTNKRRKEEAQKVRQLRDTYGQEVRLVLFLCGYFDSGYLGYEAAEGIDWVWEHRIEDMAQLGI